MKYEFDKEYEFYRKTLLPGGRVHYFVTEGRPLEVPDFEQEKVRVTLVRVDQKKDLSFTYMFGKVSYRSSTFTLGKTITTDIIEAKRAYLSRCKSAIKEYNRLLGSPYFKGNVSDYETKTIVMKRHLKECEEAWNL